MPQVAVKLNHKFEKSPYYIYIYICHNVHHRLPASGAADIEGGDSARDHRLHHPVRVPLPRGVHTEAAARHRRLHVPQAREAEDHLLVLAAEQEEEERAGGEQEADREAGL